MNTCVRARTRLCVHLSPRGGFDPFHMLPVYSRRARVEARNTKECRQVSFQIRAGSPSLIAWHPWAQAPPRKPDRKNQCYQVCVKVFTSKQKLEALLKSTGSRPLMVFFGSFAARSLPAGSWAGPQHIQTPRNKQVCFYDRFRLWSYTQGTTSSPGEPMTFHRLLSGRLLIL